MHETAAAGRSEGNSVAQFRFPESAGRKGAKTRTTILLRFPLLLSLFAITTLTTHLNCQATPTERAHAAAAVRFIPLYADGDRGLESIDDNAILNGRRLFLSSSSLHSNPLPQPVFLPTLEDEEATDPFESPLEKQKRRSPSQVPIDAAEKPASNGNQRLLRIERNANHAADKLFQIQTVGDLPVLRFGRKR